MNSTPTPETPTASPQTGEPIKLVAVKITIPVPFLDVFPASNQIGAILLDANFICALKGASLLVKGSGNFAGPLNDSFYLYEVTQPGPAIAILDAILTEMLLREDSSILFYRHGYFRPQRHDGAKIGFGFTLERMRAQLAGQVAQAERILKAADYLKEVWEKRQAAQPPETPPAAPDGQTK